MLQARSRTKRKLQVDQGQDAVEGSEKKARVASLVLQGPLGCPFTERVRLLLAERRLPHKLGLEQNVELRDVNQFRPSLTHDEKILHESTTINTYIEGLFTQFSCAVFGCTQEEDCNGAGLLPCGPYLRSVCTMWLKFVDDKIAVPFFKALLAAPEERTTYLAQLSVALFMFQEEGLLEFGRKGDSEGPWFFGKRLSLVDIAIAPFLARLPVLQALYSASFGGSSNGGGADNASEASSLLTLAPPPLPAIAASPPPTPLLLPATSASSPASSSSSPNERTAETTSVAGPGVATAPTPLTLGKQQRQRRKADEDEGETASSRSRAADPAAATPLFLNDGGGSIEKDGDEGSSVAPLLDGTPRCLVASLGSGSDGGSRAGERKAEYDDPATAAAAPTPLVLGDAGAEATPLPATAAAPRRVRRQEGKRGQRVGVGLGLGLEAEVEPREAVLPAQAGGPEADPWAVLDENTFGRLRRYCIALTARPSCKAVLLDRARLVELYHR